MINRIPFYSNTADDTHCLQACMKMIAGCFWPDKNYSFGQLDSITDKRPGLWSWSESMVVWFASQGVEVKEIGNFDYEKFIREGLEYFQEEFGEDVAKEVSLHSDINQGLKFSKEMITLHCAQKRIPEIREIGQLIKDNYIVCCNINAQALNMKQGYAGHYIIVKNIDNRGITINDPGLPGLENRLVDHKIFESAWSCPNKNARNIMAFRAAS